MIRGRRRFIMVQLKEKRIEGNDVPDIYSFGK